MEEENNNEPKTQEGENTFKETDILEKEKKTAPKKGKKPLTQKQLANLEKGRRKRHEMMKNPKNIEKPKKPQNPRPRAEMDTSSEDESEEESEEEAEYTPPPPKKTVRRSKRNATKHCRQIQARGSGLRISSEGASGYRRRSGWGKRYSHQNMERD